MTTAESLDLAAVEAQHAEPSIVRVNVDSADDVALVRDLLFAEYDVIRNGDALNVHEDTFTAALVSALHRFHRKPLEPFDRAARVTCIRSDDEPDNAVVYARIGNVWVSPDDLSPLKWSDLVVEYDVVTVGPDSIAETD